MLDFICFASILFSFTSCTVLSTSAFNFLLPQVHLVLFENVFIMSSVLGGLLVKSRIPGWQLSSFSNLKISTFSYSFFCCVIVSYSFFCQPREVCNPPQCDFFVDDISFFLTGGFKDRSVVCCSFTTLDPGVDLFLSFCLGSIVVLSLQVMPFVISWEMSAFTCKNIVCDHFPYSISRFSPHPYKCKFYWSTKKYTENAHVLCVQCR